MHKPAAVLLVLALATGCQQAYLDGAWTGTMECNNDDFDIDASFDQSLETLAVTGHFFLEYQIDAGPLLGGVYVIWSKGEIDDGEFDVEDAAVSGRIDSINRNDNNQALDWNFDLALNDSYDELSGELERFNGDGEVVATCDAELEPVADPSN